MKNILLSGLLLHLATISSAQTYPSSDCINAIPVCNRQLLIPAHAGTGEIDEINENDSTCLRSGEMNSIWLKLLITEPGLLGFNIIPLNINDSWVDLDFAVFNLTNLSCTSFDNNTMVACNFHSSVFPTPVTGLNNGPNRQDSPMLPVNIGETYYILVNNFSGNLYPESLKDIKVDFSLSTCTFCADETSLPDVNGNKHRITLYPNPAKNGFFVQYSEPFTSLRLIDLSGRSIMQHPAVQPGQWIATGTLESGVYLVQLIRADGISYTERLMIDQ